MQSKQGKSNKSGYCGVPQCNTYRGNGITMYSLPKEVRQSKTLMKEWSTVLRMGKPFPKCFSICSRHFAKESILIPAKREGIRSRTMLVTGAFPTLNLPKSSIQTRKVPIDRGKRLLNRSNAAAEKADVHTAVVETIHESSSLEGNIHEEQTCSETSDKGEHIETEFCDKGTQTDPIPFIFTSLWDTDRKINIMTGLPNTSTLEALVRACEMNRRDDKVGISMRERILLTMYKLKSNLTFAQLAVLFEVSGTSAKFYFADTIQLLAKVTKKLIYWQTKEQNIGSFKSFPNLRTILDCMEIRTITFRSLSCSTCIHSHCMGSQTLKVLIGVSTSGSINYVSKAVTGKCSNEALFNLTDLLDKLQPGDAVMVDKKFIIGDELSKAGIEMITLEFQVPSGEDAKRTTKTVSAKAHIKRKIARLKMFKVLSETVGVSVIPYMDDIMTVLCGLSNFSSPVFSGSKKTDE